MNPNSRESKKFYFKQLETAITLIFSKKHTNLKFEECYRSGYNIVQYHSKDDLIKFFKDLLDDLLTQTIQSKLANYFSLNEEAEEKGVGEEEEGGGSGSTILSKDIKFLIQLNEIWSDYQLSLNRITSILLYLDNRLKRDKSQTLYEYGLIIFFKSVIKSKKLDLLRLIKELYKMEIEKERKGEFIERNPLINTTQLFLTLSKSFYEECLEENILEFSKDYYKAEGKRLNDENLPIYFINSIYKFTANEKDRCNSYLTTSTLTKLLTIIDDECLTPYLVNNIKNETGGLKAMLEQNSREDLSKLFSISNRIPVLSLPAIVTEFKSYLLARGEAINKEVKEKLKLEPQLQLALKWTQNFLNLTNWANKICEECFKDNLKIIAGCNEAFVILINGLDRAPEFISLFIDYNMREDFKRKGDSNIEPILDKAVNLFRFLEDKDIFEKYYKQHLAKRLLANSMSSTINSDTFQDSEKIMITKLQAECGYQFTMKIEGMFKDVQYSTELTKNFKQSRETIGEALPFQFNISILTNTFWPISSQQKPAQLNLEMSNILSKFAQFYKAEFSGRKLEWITQFGSGELKLNGAKEPHDLLVNSYQLIVLMLFNDEEGEGEEGMAYEQILSLTQLEEQELQRTLQSLSCGKYKILLKSTKTKNILAGDKFKFNKNFTNPQYKIKIPMVSGRIEGTKELEKTLEEIDETRKYLIDASIVRVMKDRKLLNLNLLIIQVTNQLKGKFKLTPNQIKLRIESLIEREYLDRDENDRTVFKYLA